MCKNNAYARVYTQIYKDDCKKLFPISLSWHTNAKQAIVNARSFPKQLFERDGATRGIAKIVVALAKVNGWKLCMRVCVCEVWPD